MAISQAHTRLSTVRAISLDLDGVVYQGKHLLPGAGDAIVRLREMGLKVYFVTNSSGKTREDLARATAPIGCSRRCGRCSGIQLRFRSDYQPHHWWRATKRAGNRCGRSAGRAEPRRSAHSRQCPVRFSRCGFGQVYQLREDQHSPRRTAARRDFHRMQQGCTVSG